MTIVRQHHTSERGRPTIGRMKQPRVTVTDGMSTLTTAEVEQLCRALDYLATAKAGGARVGTMDDPTLWEALAARFREASRVRLEVTREIG